MQYTLCFFFIHQGGHRTFSWKRRMLETRYGVLLRCLSSVGTCQVSLHLCYMPSLMVDSSPAHYSVQLRPTLATQRRTQPKLTLLVEQPKSASLGFQEQVIVIGVNTGELSIEFVAGEISGKWCSRFGRSGFWRTITVFVMHGGVHVHADLSFRYVPSECGISRRRA